MSGESPRRKRRRFVIASELPTSALSNPSLTPYTKETRQNLACITSVQSKLAAALRGSGYESLVPYDLQTTPQDPGEPDRADWKVGSSRHSPTQTLIMLRFLDMGPISQNNGGAGPVASVR